VDIETREAQMHVIGNIANLHSKLWTGEIPHCSGHTHTQTNNIRHVNFMGKPPIIYMNNVGPSHNPCYGINA